MSDTMYNSMNDLQFDVLREIGNIGSGHAATALAKLLNQKIDIFLSWLTSSAEQKTL